ncbi:MAG: ABC transporter permease [Firmicutes bacterium]|nr:ABC transporter permease [Bacillota bacterium]
MDANLLLTLSILAAAVRAGTCIVYAVIGEILMERSGILNLGLEGIMLSGALAGFTAAKMTGNPWNGVLAALCAGALMSLIHGVLCISLKAGQVVSGLALTIFAGGVCGVFGKKMVGQPGSPFHNWNIPVLSDIPWIGQVFFRHDILVYLSYLLIPLAWYFLFRTRAGLNLRSVGENPQAAESLGLSVNKIRYLYILVGGALAGLGGAHLSLAYNNQWIDNMTAGRGWIAIALVIFAGWNPLKAALVSYLFGGIDAVQFRIQASGTQIPAEILLMMPYIFTIIVLIIASGKGEKQSAPAALGIPFIPGERK